MCSIIKNNSEQTISYIVDKFKNYRMQILIKQVGFNQYIAKDIM